MGEALRFAGRMKGSPEAGLVSQFLAQADFRGTMLLALLRSQARSADHSAYVRAMSWPSQQQGSLAELRASRYVTKYTQKHESAATLQGKNPAPLPPRLF